MENSIIGGIVIRRDRARPLGFAVGNHVADLVEAMHLAGHAINEDVSLSQILESWGELKPAIEATLRALADAPTSDLAWEPLESQELDAPVRPTASLIFTAANYAAHTSEAESSERVGKQVSTGSTTPYVFLKPMRSVVGPCDNIQKPFDVEQLDWEVELAAVIGSRGRRIPVDEALNYVAGYVICNDVSARDFVQRPDWPMFSSDWFAQKAFDTFTPFGPAFVPSGLIGDPNELRLVLTVDDEVMQDSLAGDMIFSIAEQIAYASRFTTLEPGDIISTGTPSGVGMARGRYLTTGETVKAMISGLGEQTNLVVDEPPGPGC